MTQPKDKSLGMAPIVDQDRLESVYDELKEMVVQLDPNPVEYGPGRFNNRIAHVRALLTRVEQIFLQVSEDLHWFKRSARGKRTLYELSRRELVVNDPKCRVGRSQKEREDLADVQLRPQIEEIGDLVADADDLEILMVAIKSKRTDLKDIQGRMRDQMKLIEHDLGMGARWGQAAPFTDTDASLNDINTLLDSVGMGTEDDEEETEETETEEVSGVEDQQDPAPTLGVTIEFHPSDLDDEVTDSIEKDIFPIEDNQGVFSESQHSEKETEDFLDTFDPTSEITESPDATEGSIEDLISSLADD